jgi:integrase
LSITSADVRAFRDYRKARGLSASTLNDTLTILSSYFNGAWRDHVISNNPCTAVEPARDTLTPAKRQKKPFTVEQVKALLGKANDDWRGLIKVAFYTGARLENCANLRFRNLDFNADPPVIVFENYSKHGDEHTLPMPPALEDHLLSLPTPQTDDVFLFPSLAGRRVANLSKQFRKLMGAARIKNWRVRESVKGKGRGAARDVWALGFHSFRRTNVSMLANAGVPEEQRMAITAHATREVHKGYTHHELATLREAMGLLPRI